MSSRRKPREQALVDNLGFSLRFAPKNVPEKRSGHKASSYLLERFLNSVKRSRVLPLSGDYASHDTDFTALQCS